MQVLGEMQALHSGRVHVVGLGGSGVRGIVPLLLARGATVSGSDKDDSPVLAQFRRSGVECWVGHSDSNVDPDTDVMLISAAVGRDNPEVQEAERQSIQVVKYAQLLGLLMSEKRGIAIAGTHGKTTTSAMVSYVLLQAGLDPSFVIGGEHPDLGGPSRSGGGDHFVAEACEFDHSFLNLAPQAAVITNVEADHLDYFDSLEEIQEAFSQFCELIPSDGFLVYNRDDENSRYLPLSCRGTVQNFGLIPGRSDWWAEGIDFEGQGSSFVLCGPNEARCRVWLEVPGEHNIRNALACAAICSWAGMSIEKIVEGLETFRGVNRRFEILAKKPCTVIDDYAHHPTEVEAVLRSARQAYPDKKIICVFQPHQHSRLRIMIDDFADVLQKADDVIVTRVYRARDSDEDVRTVCASQLASTLRSHGTNCLYADSFERAMGQLEGIVRPRSVVLFLGAGDVTDLAHGFADEVKSSSSYLR